MRRYFVLVTIFASILSLAQEAKGLELKELKSLTSRHALRAAERMSLEIYKTCPPEECLLVSLGQANTVVDSFLRVLSRSSNIPYIYEVPYTNLRALKKYELDQQAYEAYLKAMRPPPEVVQGRQVVFFRPLYEGLSIEKTLEILVNYFSKEIPRERLSALFIVRNNYRIHDFVQDLLNKLKLRHNILLDDELFNSFVRRDSYLADPSGAREYRNPIEDYHRYENIRISSGRSEVNFRKNPQFLELDQIIEEYLNRERGLIPSVRRLFNDCQKLLQQPLYSGG